jgi:hypothetical protein
MILNAKKFEEREGKNIYSMLLLGVAPNQSEM